MIFDFGGVKRLVFIITNNEDGFGFWDNEYAGEYDVLVPLRLISEKSGASFTPTLTPHFPRPTSFGLPPI